MSQYPKQKIEEQYQKLPAALKDAILSVDTANKIFEIGRKTKLTIEKVGFLAEEAGYVILGLMRPEDFVNILAERLETSTNDARSIAKEINSQIFYPLREALKATHQVEIAGEEVAKVEVMPSPSAPPTPTPPLPSQPPKVTPMPPQKIETAPPTRPVPPPAFTRSLEQERKIVPPIDLRPKPAPLPESKFLDKFAATKITPPPSKPAPLPAKPLTTPEPSAKEIKPSPLPKSAAPEPIRTKIPKPERMREAIFAPPFEPESPMAAEPKKEQAQQPPAVQPKPVEKKSPYAGYDPYKEPVE